MYRFVFLSIYLFLWVNLSYALEPQYALIRPTSSLKIDTRIQNKFQTLGESTSYIVWVSLADKGIFSIDDYSRRLSQLKSVVSQKTLNRRRKMKSLDSLVDFLDIPVYPHYEDEVKKRGVKVRATSRWFNAMSIQATGKQIQEISQLPFVTGISPIDTYHLPIEEPVTVITTSSRPVIPAKAGIQMDYGNSSAQIYQINVNLLHNLGYHGEGVTVGMLDVGYQHNTHEALTAIHVLQEYDFINNDTITQNQPGDPTGQDSHGTYTLSILAGQKDGQLYGPAYKADFLLAKTEIVNQELMVEEDYWVAGLEWEENLGADVVSSSLGYLNFDNGTTTYTYAQMDGTTRTVSKGAEIAYQQGVVVCNAMGNNGADITYPYEIAPADGLHVISAGAVDMTGTRASFSAIGPTYDGRIKPDVMAMGVSNYFALPNSTNGYGIGNGTSFSTPLTAGVAALLLQIHPAWSPKNVLDALHTTSSRSTTPDDYYGWGIINASAASQYTPPVFVTDWQSFR